ncbi:hypothetical protein [Desulfosporosinus nitroreducens]|uniref:Uncharacterized protein n=1 Tax=Desulfosporosinus nitroreducens TaxID=2018668 RepID=A0ABT8QU71_9FIRM|nr:hypothetical protein [Desulfosporosinus nitroreducens]MDO0824904.1 hypothetical protein [Desulfosporosinus nitroreducens]
MQAGGVPGQSGVRAAWPAGNVPVSRPAYERDLKPSLATTLAKVSRRVIVTLALGSAGVSVGGAYGFQAERCRRAGNGSG